MRSTRSAWLFMRWRDGTMRQIPGPVVEQESLELGDRVGWYAYRADWVRALNNTPWSFGRMAVLNPVEHGG